MKRTGIVGTQRDGAVAACDRLLEPLERLQGGPAIAVRTCVRGVDCDRLIEACERFLRRSSLSSTMPRLQWASAKSGAIASARSQLASASS